MSDQKIAQIVRHARILNEGDVRGRRRKEGRNEKHLQLTTHVKMKAMIAVMIAMRLRMASFLVLYTERNCRQTSMP